MEFTKVEIECDVCGRVETASYPDHVGPLAAVEFAEMQFLFTYFRGQWHCKSCLIPVIWEYHEHSLAQGLGRFTIIPPPEGRPRRYLPQVGRDTWTFIPRLPWERDE